MFIRVEVRTIGRQIEQLYLTFLPRHPFLNQNGMVHF